MAMATRADRSRHPWEGHYPLGLAWNADIAVRPLTAVLEMAAARFPRHVCIDYFGRGYTYAEITTLVGRAATGLRRLGVGRGVKVALFLPNCPYFVIGYFAVLAAGGTVVPCNPLITRAELARQVQDSNAELVITADVAELYDKAAGLLAAGPSRRIVVCPMAQALPWLARLLFEIRRWRQRAAIPTDARHLSFRSLLRQTSDDTPDPAAAADDIAVIQYTGGTTGEPKGVMLSHANLYANTCQIQRWFTTARAGAERILAVLPLAHAFGMTAVMNLALSLGAAMVMLPRFDLGECLRTIERRKVTMLLGVPTLFQAIAQRQRLAKVDLSSLRIAVSGGDALPEQVRQRFLSLTGCPVAEGYGLTECSPVVACSNPLAGIAKAGSSGLPLPGTVVDIVSLDDPAMTLPPGELGQVRVAGPQVMLGYWQRPEATSAVMSNGRLLTGDIGRLDADGYLYLVDRLKEVIVVHGYKVYPRLVEAAIRAHPAVADVAVVGVPHRVRGHVPKAFVVPRADVTAEELRAFLAGKVSAVAVPREIVFQSSLPKSASGKILKSALSPQRIGEPPAH